MFPRIYYSIPPPLFFSFSFSDCLVAKGRGGGKGGKRGEGEGEEEEERSNKANDKHDNYDESQERGVSTNVEKAN